MVFILKICKEICFTFLFGFKLTFHDVLSYSGLVEGDDILVEWKMEFSIVSKSQIGRTMKDREERGQQQGESHVRLCRPEVNRIHHHVITCQSQH